MPFFVCKTKAGFPVVFEGASPPARTELLSTHRTIEAAIAARKEAEKGRK